MKILLQFPEEHIVNLLCTRHRVNAIIHIIAFKFDNDDETDLSLTNG